MIESVGNENGNGAWHTRNKTGRFSQRFLKKNFTKYVIVIFIVMNRLL